MSTVAEELLQLLAGEEKAKEESEEALTALPKQTPKDLVIDYQRTSLERLKEEIEGIKQDRKQRKIFGYVIFAFMCVYMLAVLVLVYLSGFDVVRLSDGVVVTLVTTSLANVIGIFNFVVKYLFHTK